MKAKEEYVDAPRETRSKDITVYAIIFLVLLVGAGIFLALGAEKRRAGNALPLAEHSLFFRRKAVERGKRRAVRARFLLRIEQRPIIRLCKSCFQRFFASVDMGYLHTFQILHGLEQRLALALHAQKAEMFHCYDCHLSFTTSSAIHCAVRSRRPRAACSILSHSSREQARIFFVSSPARCSAAAIICRASTSALRRLSSIVRAAARCSTAMRRLASACAAAYCSASCFSSSCTCCNSSIAMLSFTSFDTVAGAFSRPVFHIIDVFDK